MGLNLKSDDFELLGLERAFALRLPLLEARRRELQTQVHPDRFAGQSAAEQRLALQWAVRVNEAYQRLKDPLRRAAYLCEQRGAPIDAERNTAMPTAFLMQQMQWREGLDEAATLADVEQIEAEVAGTERQWLADVQKQLDADNDPTAAAALVRALMFVQRFRQDIERRLDRLDSTR